MTCLLLSVFDDLPDFQGADFSFRTELLYFLARSLDPLETIFPFATFLGVSFMTIVKGKNSELTAIRAAGLSLLVTALPVWGLCLFLCGAEMYLMEVVKPAANRYADEVRVQLEHHRQLKKRLDARVKEELERQLKEQNGANSDRTTSSREEQIAKENEIRRALAQVEANSGSHPTRQKGQNALSYYNAQNRTEWQFADFRVAEPCHGIVVWVTDTSGRLLSRRIAHQAQYDSVTQKWLFQGGETVQFEYLETDELPHPSSIVRHGDDEITQMPYAETPQEIELLHHQPDELNLKGLIRMLRFADRLPDARRRFVRTMVAYRLFYPLSTLVAGLLGFALTITQGRKSAITGFVIAAVLLMFYYSFAQQAVVMGRSGLLSPFAAGALPTILALSGSLLLAWKRQ